MKRWHRKSCLLLAYIVAVGSNPYPVYHLLNDSVQATLYLDIVDHDEDLFIHARSGSDDHLKLVHQEESNRDAGTKSSLLKRKFNLYLTVFKNSPGRIPYLNHEELFQISLFPEIRFKIFHPPDTIA